MNLRSLTAMATVTAALTIAPQARADVIDFFLTQGECTGGCGAGTAPAPITASNADAVEVIVTTTTGSAGDWTGATVEFLGVNDGATNIDTPAYINVNGTPSTDFTATVSIAGGVTYGDQAEDHFGNMNVWTGAVKSGTVTFTLTAADSYFWTNAADVLTPTTGYGAAYSHGFEAVTASQYAGYYTPVPAPLIGHGVPGILAVAGVLFGAGLIKRGKKRGSFGVAHAG